MTDRAPISWTIDDRILVRGRDLADELIGRMSFTEMFLLDLHGEVPSPSHVRMVEAVLVSMMEHGITPSTLAARLVLDGAPESTQGAVAAGLLATGSRFLGVTEQAAVFVQRVVSATGRTGVAAAARDEIKATIAEGGKVPGFGHNLHHRVDPRVVRLIELSRQEGVFGANLAALHEVGQILNEGRDTPLIMNAAGVAGAALSDLGYHPPAIRGFALIARCAGLVAHVMDELDHPIGRAVWQHAHETPGQGLS
jgi:citrate synthase